MGCGEDAEPLDAAVDAGRGAACGSLASCCVELTGTSAQACSAVASTNDERSCVATLTNFLVQGLCTGINLDAGTEFDLGLDDAGEVVDSGGAAADTGATDAEAADLGDDADSGSAPTDMGTEEDAGALVDSGSPEDAGAPISDAGAPMSDAGSPMSDAGFIADGGMSMPDGGFSFGDGGFPFGDGGFPFGDGGFNFGDGGLIPPPPDGGTWCGELGRCCLSLPTAQVAGCLGEAALGSEGLCALYYVLYGC